MAKIFVYFSCLLSFCANSQQLTTQELESFLKLDISKAQDFIETKGYEYRGSGYTGSAEDSFYKYTNVIRFESPTDYKKSITLVYDPKQLYPIMINYNCPTSELKEKKNFYLKKGFKLISYSSNKKILKYFFDKKGSPFSLTFGSGYDNEHKISFSGLQVVRKL
jgi:hypothetical protein